MNSCQSSCKVTPSRGSSRWTHADSGSARPAFAALDPAKTRASSATSSRSPGSGHRSPACLDRLQVVGHGPQTHAAGPDDRPVGQPHFKFQPENFSQLAHPYPLGRHPGGPPWEDPWDTRSLPMRRDARGVHLARNERSPCPESVFTIARNQCSASPGISVQLGPESAQGDQHGAQTLVGQTGWPRANLDSVRLSDLDTATHRLGIQTHLAGDLLLRSAADPQPQDFLHFEQSHLAIRHLPSRLGQAEAEEGGRWPFSPARRGGGGFEKLGVTGGGGCF